MGGGGIKNGNEVMLMMMKTTTDLHVDGTPDYLQLFQHQHQHHVGPKKSFLKVTDRSFHAILIHHPIICRVSPSAQLQSV